MDHKATESLTLEEVVALLPRTESHAQHLLAALRRIADIPQQPDLLDIGSAGGAFLLAAAKLGCKSVGLEPWDQARKVTQSLADQEHLSLQVHAGMAEKLPFLDETFDIVHAASVLEHVDDPAKVFSEVRRVLRKRGVFWFFTASSMCPRQEEIRGFPLFGWYPDACKRRIMIWARDHKPALVGFGTRPAMHWFTPHKAKTMLLAAGFHTIYDLWDLANPAGRLSQSLLRVIRRFPPARLAANLCHVGCAYAALK